MNLQQRDTLLVLGAYTSWGVLPLYWKLLAAVPAPVVLGHRVFWSVVVLGVLLAWSGKLKHSLRSFADGKKLMRIALCAALLASNWLVYVWAMGNGYIIESGLGYFLCPILSLVLSAAFLGETLSPQKSLAVVVTICGVLVKVVALGALPWVALSLAVNFALYLAFRKSVASDPVQSLFQEVVVVLIVLATLSGSRGVGTLWSDYGVATQALLILSGPITALPLLMLIRGLRSVSLQSSAMMQYIAPSLTVLMGLLSGEKLSLADAVALPVIWLGVALYASADRWSWKRVELRRT